MEDNSIFLQKISVRSVLQATKREMLYWNFCLVCLLGEYCCISLRCQSCMHQCLYEENETMSSWQIQASDTLLIGRHEMISWFEKWQVGGQSPVKLLYGCLTIEDAVICEIPSILCCKGRMESLYTKTLNVHWGELDYAQFLEVLE